MRRGDRDAFWGSAAHFLKSLITRWKKISSNLAEDDCQHLLAEWKASRACYNTGTSSNHTNPVVSTVNKTSRTVIIYSQPGNKAHPGKKEGWKKARKWSVRGSKLREKDRTTKKTDRGGIALYNSGRGLPRSKYFLPFSRFFSEIFGLCFHIIGWH